MTRFFKLFIVLALSAAGAHAQDVSNKGKEFWVGYGHHQFMENLSNTQEMVIYLSAEQAAVVKVSIDSSLGNWSQTFNIPANTVVSCGPMPKSGTNDCRLYDVPISFGGIGGEGIFRRKGIHIESDVPIVAYAHIYGSASSGASMLMPIESWGHQYITVNSDQVYANNCFSWFYVISRHDSTMVEITPSVPSVLGRPANVPFTVMLMKGQIYQYTAAIQSGSTGYNASGSKVKSIANISGDCYPVAVFAGSSRTGNPAACGTGGGDNDNQQCFPTQAWGKRYLTAPTSSSTAAATFQTNNYRILVKDPTTVVKRNGVTLAGIINNSYYKFESNAGELIEADKPIMVAQHMTGGGCLNGGVGDPEMIYLSPVEQAINRIGFYRNNREAITTNYLTMIVPAAAVGSVRIDGSPVVDHTYIHPRDANYRVVIKRWGSAQAQCIVTCDSAFTAITYGLGSVESYGYNAGTYLKNLNVIGSIRNPADSSAVTEHQFTCQETPVKISAFIRYKPTRLVWRVSQVGPQISPNTDVTDNAPVPTDSTFLFGVRYYKYTIPGTYMFSDTGTYTLPVLSSHPSIENCYLTEEIPFQIKVKARPRPDFSFTPGTAVCELDSIQFTGAAATLNSYTVQQFQWTFPGPVADSGQTVRHILPAGANNVMLRVVTTDGCVWDTTKVVNTYAKPVADFNISPAAICQGGTATLTDNSTYGVAGALLGWYWDFGNGNTVNAGNGNPQNPTYPNSGNISVRLAVKVSNTCVSDTVTKILPVWAKPFASFSFPANTCLPTNGQITFTNAASVPDGQTLSYIWDFGDASPTSNATNPTHTYAAEGNYSVKLTVNTANSCTKDTTIQVNIKITPALNYGALNPICESATTPVSIATATVTNGITGTGIYRGPGTNAAGSFNPSAAGAGTHTIWYVFTTTGGCKDSVSQTIQVRAKPFASFSFPSGCFTNGQITFNNLSTISDAQTLSYVWDFGDASPTSNATNPTHTYAAEGTFPVKLTVNTNNSCTKDTTINVPISIRPALNYPALAGVCENTTAFSIATATVTNGITGTGIYRGPGTNTVGNFNPATAGSGTHTIWYVFTTTGGCKDSVSQTIQVRAKPFASFSFPAGCFTNGQITFNNLSTISDAQTLSYVWDFGDASPTSNATNPTHTYAAEGTFPVKLTVNTNNSCTKDTTINVPISIRPALNYPALSAVCENIAPFSIATATVTNGITGTGIYRGPGTNTAGNFNPVTAGFGTHTIWYVFTTTGGCKDSISQTIQVRAKPFASFTFTAGCLATNGQMAFTNASTIPDAQTLSYIWNFGDASPTSNATSPTHNYAAENTYPVRLTVNTNNGCTKDTTINVPVKITPALNYPALTPVCASVTTPFSIAGATVTNGITGTGIYRGPGTNAAGMFNPAAAGAGNHTIWYVFTTTGGCKDSVSQNMQVQPKPVSLFNVAADVCLGQSVTITDNSSIGVGNIDTWRWDFGDATTVVNTNGNPFTKTYTTAGPFTIKLVTVSNNGCTSDTVSRTVNVRPLPVASFNMPASVCMPNNPVQFTNNSTIPGNGTLAYIWDFGDASPTSNATSPSHVYAAINSYNIRLTARSAFGCTDDSVRTFSAFFDKPVANFDVNPDTLCQGSDNVFTDLSNAPNSTLQTWKWIFGDGATSGVRNPTKRYINPGTYSVQLIVTNAVGCISDTFKKPVVVYLQPVIDAGPSFVVPQGTTIQFNATANDPASLSFAWSPATGLSNPAILKPSLVAMSDQTYILLAIGQGSCTATDLLSVKILKPVKVPNAFSPNGDGINDTWVIENISDYPGATVEVFNRYGQAIFFSEGYSRPWDGTYKGAALPVATYYYIIRLNNGFKPLNGSITIVK